MIDDITFSSYDPIFELDAGTLSVPLDIVYDEIFREDIPALVMESITIFV